MPATGPALSEFFRHCIFLAVATFFALFFAFYGWSMTKAEQERQRARVEQGQRVLTPKVKTYENVFSWFELAFQFWFNAIGGFVGWIAVWFLWESPFSDYGWKHLVVLVLAFSGITGNLPFLSTGVRAAIIALGGAVAALVGKLAGR